MHNDKAIHGSQANPSARRRAGLTIRYSGTNVKADLKVSPDFVAHLCRGTDTFGHTPYASAPTQRYGRKDYRRAWTASGLIFITTKNTKYTKRDRTLKSTNPAALANSCFSCVSCFS